MLIKDTAKALSDMEDIFHEIVRTISGRLPSYGLIIAIVICLALLHALRSSAIAISHTASMIQRLTGDPVRLATAGTAPGLWSHLQHETLLGA